MWHLWKYIIRGFLWHKTPESILVTWPVNWLHKRRSQFVFGIVRAPNLRQSSTSWHLCYFSATFFPPHISCEPFIVSKFQCHSAICWSFVSHTAGTVWPNKVSYTFQILVWKAVSTISHFLSRGSLSSSFLPSFLLSFARSNSLKLLAGDSWRKDLPSLFHLICSRLPSQRILCVKHWNFCFSTTCNIFLPCCGRLCTWSSIKVIYLGRNSINLMYLIFFFMNNKRMKIPK